MMMGTMFFDSHFRSETAIVFESAAVTWRFLFWF